MRCLSRTDLVAGGGGGGFAAGAAFGAAGSGVVGADGVVGPDDDALGFEVGAAWPDGDCGEAVGGAG
jgi:hypothetical protein